MDRSPLDPDEAWTAIDAQRQSLVRLLEGLSAEDWRRPSLCAGWTVRQVAAHVALQNTRWSQLPRAVLDLARHGGLDGAIHAAACRHAERPVDEIIGEIRDRIGVHRALPTLTFRESAIDYLVHGQDIALPLGCELAMPARLAALAADRVWSSARMFHAARRFAGYRFTADDIDWTVGQGPQVRGPIGALLLLLTGRSAALAQLTGPGVAALRARPTSSAR
jgi:uncharacterized protein (TIGR03083 family)